MLERTSPSNTDIIVKSELKNFEVIKHVVKEEALSLPVAAIFNNELANKIVEAIKNIQIISMTAARILNQKNLFLIHVLKSMQRYYLKQTRQLGK